MGLTIHHEDYNLARYNYSFEDVGDDEVILKISNPKHSITYHLWGEGGSDAKEIKTFMSKVLDAANDNSDEDLMISEDEFHSKLEIELDDDLRTYGWRIIHE